MAFDEMANRIGVRRELCLASLCILRGLRSLRGLVVKNLPSPLHSLLERARDLLERARAAFAVYAATARRGTATQAHAALAAARLM